MSPPDVVPPTYTPEEEATLSENLLAVTAAVYRGDTRGRPLRPELLCALHDSLFRGVREHAGRMRGHGFGSEVLRFGPWYSAHRHDVQKKIEALCAEVRRALDEITDAPEAPDYEDAALRLALTAHDRGGATQVGQAGVGATADKRDIDRQPFDMLAFFDTHIGQ